MGSDAPTRRGEGTCKNKKILIVGGLHPIDAERIKELKKRNGFKVFEQLSLF